jgi:hypothetical protein
LEVVSVSGRPFSSLFEFHGKRDIGIVALYRVEMHHGVHLPFPRLVAVGAAFVVAGVVNPDLSDVALCQRQRPWQGLAPRLGFFLVAGGEAHDVVEDNKVHTADFLDEGVYPCLALGRIERFHSPGHVLMAERKKTFRVRADALGLG